MLPKDVKTLAKGPDQFMAPGRHSCRVRYALKVKANLFERARVQGTNRGVFERYRAGRCLEILE